MSNLNNQFRELINEAVDNSFRNNIEMKIILKDWLHGMCKLVDEYEAKAKAFDEIIHAINISSQPRQSGRRYIDKFEFTKKAENIIEKYERGEPDELRE